MAAVPALWLPARYSLSINAFGRSVASAARRPQGLTFFGPRPRTARLFYRSGSLPSDDSETESELCAVAGGPVNWWGQLHAKTLKLTLPARSEGSETVRLIV